MGELQTNAVRFELNDEKQERVKLDDGVFAPAIPENTPQGLNGDDDTFHFYPQRIHARQVISLLPTQYTQILTQRPTLLSLA